MDVSPAKILISEENENISLIVSDLIKNKNGGTLTIREARSSLQTWNSGEEKGILYEP